MGYIANVLDELINDMKLVDIYLGPQRLGSYHENEDTSEFQSEISRVCQANDSICVI